MSSNPVEAKIGRSVKQKNEDKRKQLNLEDVPPADLKSKLQRNYTVVYAAYIWVLQIKFSKILVSSLVFLIQKLLNPRPSVITLIILYDLIRVLDLTERTRILLETIVKISNDGKLYL